MEYISVKKAAEKWDVSQRYVQRCCTEGRIEGARKIGGVWMIPPDAEKPEALRKVVQKPLQQWVEGQPAGEIMACETCGWRCRC